MTIPRDVKVGGLYFNIVYEKNLIRDSTAFGSSCGNAQQIRLDAEMSDQMKKQTFIHEVLHAIDFVYSLGLKHDLVSKLEAALYAFIVDNPETFK